MGIGKLIGGKVYLHRMYEDKLPADLLETAKNNLPPEIVNTYNIVCHNRKTDAITFTYSPDFDTADEPILLSQYTVSKDGKVRIRTYNSTNFLIYHHKWLMVADDYPGFDVQVSKDRSREWLLFPDLDFRRIGCKQHWDQFISKQNR